jgi:hypothetical protein
MGFFDYLDATRDRNRVAYEGYRNVGGFDEILAQLQGVVTDELLQSGAFKTKVHSSRTLAASIL